MENSQQNKIYKTRRGILSFFSYTYLFTGYISIFCYFAYNIKMSNVCLTLIATIFFFLIYFFTNHKFIKTIIQTKTLIIFESTLAISLLVVPFAYIKEQFYPDFLYEFICRVCEAILNFLFSTKYIISVA